MAVLSSLAFLIVYIACVLCLCLIDRLFNCRLLCTIIEFNHSKLLSNANTHDTRKLWTLITSSDVWYKNCRSEYRVNSATSNEINEHFANIATDPLYVKELVTRGAYPA